jgi:hypothetical protein
VVSKAFTDMMLKNKGKRERKYKWGLNSDCPHSRWAGSQLSYHGWHDGMCFNTAYTFIVKKLKNKS